MGGKFGQNDLMIQWYYMGKSYFEDYYLLCVLGNEGVAEGGMKIKELFFVER